MTLFLYFFGKEKNPPKLAYAVHNIIFVLFLFQMYSFLIKILLFSTANLVKYPKIKHKNENGRSEEYIISVYYTINFIISPFSTLQHSGLPVLIYFTIKPSILVLPDLLSRYFLSVVTISQHDCRSVSVAFVSVLAPSLLSLREIGGLREPYVNHSSGSIIKSALFGETTADRAKGSCV